MSDYHSISGRRFFRNKKKAMIGGVCAGFADYFGFSLKVTRLLAVLALLFAAPMAILVYIGVVLLVPQAPERREERDYDPGFRRALRSSPRRTLSEVRRRFQSLDSRLARLERHVTSPRFNLDQEFKNL